MDEVLATKAASIERCLKRVLEESTHDWKTNLTHQDALILNLERACQASIDTASNIVRQKKLGIPSESKEVFVLLEKSSTIPNEMSDRLKKMVGFRNLAVHEYRKLSLAVVEQIIEKELVILRQFASILLQIDFKTPS